jgi:hypothetical protein
MESTAQVVSQRNAPSRRAHKLRWELRSPRRHHDMGARWRCEEVGLDPVGDKLEVATKVPLTKDIVVGFVWLPIDALQRGR